MKGKDFQQIHTRGALFYDKMEIRTVALVDFDNGVVIVTEYIGGHQAYEQRVIPIEDFQDFIVRYEYERKLTQERNKTAKTKGPSSIHFEIPVDIGRTWRTIVGEGGVGLKVSGRHEITLQGRSEWQEGQVYVGSKFPSLHMEQRSNFTITGTIGSKIKVNVNQDSERERSLENTINIKYEGEEDDIIRSIEAGNTNIGLSGTQFVGYSETVKGLFGLKTQLRIGDLEIVGIASQEQGQTERKSRSAGASRRTYEVLDKDYKRNYYFWIDDRFLFGVDRVTGEPLRAGDSITDFILYTTENRGTINMISGWACYDLSTPDTTTDAEHGSFYKMDESEYWLNRKDGWISLDRRFPDGHILACSYVIRHSDGTYDTIGDFGDTLVTSSTSRHIKLIMPRSLGTSSRCWDYMFRNVYDLGFINLKPDEVKIDIITQINDENIFPLTGRPYVELWGLDSMDATAANISDGYVDSKDAFINFARGELIFPCPHPFAPQDVDLARIPNLSMFSDTFQVPGIYTSTDQNLINQQSTYAIRIETTSRSTTMELGFGVILDGSETVKLNSETLIKGTDYIIDYNTGRLSFISDRARDPNANIRIDYERQPYFMVEQKTLLGTRRAIFLIWMIDHG